MQPDQQQLSALGFDPSCPFLSEVAGIRRRARLHIRRGAVTPSYGAERDVVLRLLNEALATELVCVVRYKRHYFMAGVTVAEAVRAELLRHAADEQGHADHLAERIVALGGAPNLSSEGMLQRSHSECVEGETLADMLAEDLIAERIVIESYRESIQYLGDQDISTRRLLESILAVEEEHAEDLRRLREDMLRRERVADGNSSSNGNGDGHRSAELQ